MEHSPLARSFLDLHVPGEPLLLPNPHDVGTAKLLTSMGFAALATTSGGFASTLGLRDGQVAGPEAMAHAAAIAEATDVPVTADLEDGYGRTPNAVRQTVTDAAAVGLAGCSIEDYTRDRSQPLYDIDLAAERVQAAAEAAHSGPNTLVLTARAENYFRGRPDLDETIKRLQAYEAAGADVLFAPGMTDLNDIREMVAACARPVNALLMPNGPSLADLRDVGVARVSVGSAFAYIALHAAADAARDFLNGAPLPWAAVRSGHKVARAAFANPE